MTDTRALFVGGPWHARFTDIPTYCHAWNVARVGGDVITYRSREFSFSAGRPIRVFTLHGSVTADEVVNALLQAAAFGSGEHPVRCPARLSMFAFVRGDHTHECIHPAMRPDSVEGLIEHQCQCGATWTDLAVAPARNED